MSGSSIASCLCGSGLRAPARWDARMIFLTYACDRCWPQRRAGYRPEVLTDANYETTEDVDAD